MNNPLHLQAWSSVLPWLTPLELASLASTCSALARSISSLTHHRISDISHSLEPYPIPVLNAHSYPYFAYSPSSCLPHSTLRRWHWGSLLPPLRRPSPFLVDHPFHLQHRPQDGIGCRCSSDCSQSVVSCSREEELGDSNRFVDGLHAFHAADDNRGWDEMGCIPLPKRSRGSKICVPGTNCTCGRTSDGQIAYDVNSKLCFLTEMKKIDDTCSSGEELTKEDFETPFVLECGPACSCNSTCKYRVSQHGLAVKVFITRDRLKGWSMHAAQPIAKACFVCEYAGELLTTFEARDRQKVYDLRASGRLQSASALLVLREHLPSGQACLRLNIDSTRVGNVARFINHSCDGGNLLPCIIRLTGSVIPKLAFFATRDICEGEELTFSYGQVEEGANSRPCYCATAACRGVLPSEQT